MQIKTEILLYTPSLKNHYSRTITLKCRMGGKYTGRKEKLDLILIEKKTLRTQSYYVNFSPQSQRYNRLWYRRNPHQGSLTRTETGHYSAQTGALSRCLSMR